MYNSTVHPAFFLAIQLPFHYSRISGSQRVVGNVTDHHTTGRNDATAANGHARTDDHPAPQPSVVPYRNRVFRLFGFPAFDVVYGMLGCVKLAVGADKHMIADADVTAVQESAVVVDESMLPYYYAVAVVAMERRGDGRRFRNTRNKLLQHLTVTIVMEGHGLEARCQFSGMHGTFQDFRIRKIGHLLTPHLFKFCFHKANRFIVIAVGAFIPPASDKVTINYQNRQPSSHSLVLGMYGFMLSLHQTTDYMKKIILSFLAGMGLCSSCASGKDIKVLTPEAFISAARADSSAVILDVRKPEEFAGGHVKGAVLLNVLDETAFNEGLGKLDKSRHYYVYCRSGKRSHTAAEKMVEQGFTVFDMEGGFLNWTSRGLPVEK